MPTYDYHCEKCGETYEVFQSMNDAKLETCTREGCGGKVRRLLGTGAAVIFKGSGFYETDYRSKSYQEGAKKESEAGKSGGEKKSESKGGGTKSSEGGSSE